MAPRLSGRQLDVMQVLWQVGEASVAEIQAGLEVDPPLAYTTVATLLRRLENKGVVEHREEGRTFVYRPLVSRGRLGRTLVADVIDDVFEGSPARLVSHLLESDQVDAAELDRLKELIADHEARRAGNGGRRAR